MLRCIPGKELSLSYFSLIAPEIANREANYSPIVYHQNVRSGTSIGRVIVDRNECLVEHSRTAGNLGKEYSYNPYYALIEHVQA